MPATRPRAASADLRQAGSGTVRPFIAAKHFNAAQLSAFGAPASWDGLQGGEARSRRHHSRRHCSHGHGAGKAGRFEAGSNDAGIWRRDLSTPKWRLHWPTCIAEAAAPGRRGRRPATPVAPPVAVAPHRPGQ
eukprot:NODE_19298_length_850_cov_2.260028.p1 GENE.NODE_19298_length_850_cov_2.260028~~NODE_19298_length_850_cov_2.260028.p1  ORF type:complete len:133 (+),score=20.23 NODE_19298_length_850_cov_2.260028:365-763(+)